MKQTLPLNFYSYSVEIHLLLIKLILDFQSHEGLLFEQTPEQLKVSNLFQKLLEEYS